MVRITQFMHALPYHIYYNSYTLRAWVFRILILLAPRVRRMLCGWGGCWGFWFPLYCGCLSEVGLVWGLLSGVPVFVVFLTPSSCYIYNFRSCHGFYFGAPVSGVWGTPFVPIYWVLLSRSVYLLRTQVHTFYMGDLVWVAWERTGPSQGVLALRRLGWVNSSFLVYTPPRVLRGRGAWFVWFNSEQEKRSKY